jgi:Holliday junction resolvase RusA-like endonuclease
MIKYYLKKREEFIALWVDLSIEIKQREIEGRVVTYQMEYDLKTYKRELDNYDKAIASYTPTI